LIFLSHYFEAFQSFLCLFEINTYYDVLLENLVDLQKQVNELDKDIEYYELLIKRLEGEDPLFFVTIEKQEEEALKVDASILSANATLKDIIVDANKILVEYNAFTTSNIIKPLITPAYESSTSVLLISAIGFVIGAGIGTVVVLFKHDWE
jgi:hypothetical protein